MHHERWSAAPCCQPSGKGPDDQLGEFFAENDPFFSRPAGSESAIQVRPQLSDLLRTSQIHLRLKAQESVTADRLGTESTGENL